MNKLQFQKWLNKLGAAWINRDPNAASNLFAQKVTYYEYPFEKPYKNRQAVKKLWDDVPVSQKAVTFKHDIITITKDTGIAHFTAEFTRKENNKRVLLDGIFLVRLNEDIQCAFFKWWWVTKE